MIDEKRRRHTAPNSVVMTGYHMAKAREYGKKMAEHLRQAHECTYQAEEDILALDGVEFFQMEPEKGRRIIGQGIAGAHYAGEAHNWFRRFILREGVAQPTAEQFEELGGGGR